MTWLFRAASPFFISLSLSTVGFPAWALGSGWQPQTLQAASVDGIPSNPLGSRFDDAIALSLISANSQLFLPQNSGDRTALDSAIPQGNLANDPFAPPTPVSPEPSNEPFAPPTPIDAENSTSSEDELPELPQLNAEPVELTLFDVVVLALENNRDIQNAYLERRLQQQVLDSEEAKFTPNFRPEINVALDRDNFEDFSSNDDALRLNTRVTVEMPTGASLEASIGTGTTPPTDATSDDIFPVDRLTQDLQVVLTQPLLQGAGSEINRASIEIARLDDAINGVFVRATLMDTITETIRAYRRLLQAQEALRIQELALESARTQLEVTQALVEGGRIAPVDLVTPETQVANREVGLVEAQNRLVQAQLQLLQVLDLDRPLQPVAADIPDIDSFDEERLQVERLLPIALENNPQYLQLQLRRQRQDLSLLLAEDARRWQLDVEARYQQDWQGLREEREAWSAGLRLRREFFGDERLELAVSRLETSIALLENDLLDLRDDLDIAIRDAVRDIEAKFRQVELARRARELSQQQLENEREKLRLGLGNTRAIDIVNFENDLVNAENAELNAEIAYLNALTELERLVGITLQTWNVEIELEGESETERED